MKHLFDIVALLILIVLALYRSEQPASWKDWIFIPFLLLATGIIIWSEFCR